MSSPIYMPETREKIIRMLGVAQFQWLETMMIESFDSPRDPQNISMMLSAQATAINMLLTGHPQRDALIKTLALDLLDAAEPAKR